MLTLCNFLLCEKELAGLYNMNLLNCKERPYKMVFVLEDGKVTEAHEKLAVLFKDKLNSNVRYYTHLVVNDDVDDEIIQYLYEQGLTLDLILNNADSLMKWNKMITASDLYKNIDDNLKELFENEFLFYSNVYCSDSKKAIGLDGLKVLKYLEM